MKGLIAAAGLSSRLQDLGEKRNKVLSDRGGETLLGNLLNHFENAGVGEILVAVGHDALQVRGACKGRAVCILNPFHESTVSSAPSGSPVPISTANRLSSPLAITIARLGDSP